MITTLGSIFRTTPRNLPRYENNGLSWKQYDSLILNYRIQINTYICRMLKYAQPCHKLFYWPNYHPGRPQVLDYPTDRLVWWLLDQNSWKLVSLLHVRIAWIPRRWISLIIPIFITIIMNHSLIKLFIKNHLCVDRYLELFSNIVVCGVGEHDVRKMLGFSSEHIEILIILVLCIVDHNWDLLWLADVVLHLIDCTKT